MSAVTLSEAKAYLNVDFIDDDVLIQSLIDASEDWIGRYTNHILSPVTKVYGVGTYSIADYPISVTASTGSYKIEECSLNYNLRVSSGTVTASIGYANATLVPKSLISAVKKMVVYLYENRDVYPSELPFDVQILINKYRRFILV